MDEKTQDAIQDMARVLDKIGFNDRHNMDGGMAGHPGALEKIAMELETINRTLIDSSSNLVEAIGGLAETVERLDTGNLSYLEGLDDFINALKGMK